MNVNCIACFRNVFFRLPGVLVVFAFSSSVPPGRGIPVVIVAISVLKSRHSFMADLFDSFATSLPPHYLLFASSDSEDPSRRIRGGIEENPRRKCDPSHVLENTVPCFHKYRHIF